MKRTLLIDADIVAFKFAAATESVFFFDGKAQPPAVTHSTEEACEASDDYIAELQSRLGATDVVVCLTCTEGNFRKDIWPDYKANRVGVRKPTDLAAVKEHFKKRYQTYLRPRLEADDCMGILATHPTLVPGEKIIISEDKDMQSVPGLLFNPRKDAKPRKIGQLAADRFHLAQTIIGDTCDNYPGAKGIGPKSPEVAAVMASKTVEEAWRHVLAAFARSASKYATGALDSTIARDATAQARCARILRASDWDFKTKRPVLWCPPAV